MKIAIPAVSNIQTATIDARFGRTAWFMVYDTESKAWEAIENISSLQSAQ
jgi:predicted Fe-Mo cluster-binding NifX family protein